MKKDKKIKLAIFDIDGTIFRSSLLIELVNGLTVEGVFPKSIYEEMEKDYIAWLNRKGSYVAYLEKVINLFNKNIGGCSEEDVGKVVDKMLLNEKEKMYVFTRDLVKKARAEGYFLMAISGSPDFIVSKFSEYVGFDICYGSVFGVKEGYFTGKILNKESWAEKDIVIGNFIKKHECGIDLKHSMAVGDSSADIPMLESVGKPIAFNPDNTLAFHAKKKGWSVIVERKNVVYKIKDFDFDTY